MARPTNRIKRWFGAGFILKLVVLALVLPVVTSLLPSGMQQLPIVSAFAIQNAQAAIARVQSTFNNAENTNSINATYPAALTANNLLIVMVTTRDSVTINAPAGWQTAVNSSGAPGHAVFYKYAGGGEPSLVTV